MSFLRGYRIYEPSNPASPNPLTDSVVKELVDGIDFTGISNINWDETITSTYLQAGAVEYRYVCAFDDENTGSPSSVFSVLNLVPPSLVSAVGTDFDKIALTFTNVNGAASYKYKVTKVSNGQIVIQTLDSDKIIKSLEASNTYNIQVASVNSDGIETGYSNTVSADTLTLLNLLGVVGNRNVTWTWEYNINTNTDHFELRNNDTGALLYSGLSKSFSQSDIPVQRLNYYVKLVNKDSTTRNSEIVTVDIYDDNSIITSTKENTLTDGISRVATKNDMYIEDVKDFLSKENYFIDTFIDFANNYTVSLDTKDSTKLNMGIYSDKSDLYQSNHQYSSSTVDNFGDIENYSSTFTTNIGYSVGSNNSFIDRKALNQGLTIDYKNNFSGRQDIGCSFLTNISCDYFVAADSKFLNKLSLGINNSLTTPSGFKMGSDNRLTTVLTSGRSLFYNSIKPFNIEHKDIIWNLIIKPIDIESKINKVRILCLGDSITAGAPGYDPQYGGTVWMKDLITGDFKTRNRIESEYPYWLQLKLGLDDFEVINEGSGRRTSSEVLFHLADQLAEYKPQFVIVLIGTNDVFFAQNNGKEFLDNTVNTALFNIRTITEQIINSGATPILGTNLPRNSIVPPEAKDALRQLNIGIKNLGIEKVIDIIDWYNIFVQKPNGIENGLGRPELIVDDTHPSVDGYKLMADSINLGILNSFRATLRIFRSMNGEDVNYSTEETKILPDPYTINYKMELPIMRRLQNYVINRYIKNTGNSYGMFILELDDKDNLVMLWDEEHKQWTKKLIGQLAPNQILNLKIKFTLPAIGRYKDVNFNMNYIVRR